MVVVCIVLKIVCVKCDLLLLIGFVIVMILLCWILRLNGVLVGVSWICCMLKFNLGLDLVGVICFGVMVCVCGNGWLIIVFIVVLKLIGVVRFVMIWLLWMIVV